MVDTHSENADTAQAVPCGCRRLTVESIALVYDDTGERVLLT